MACNSMSAIHLSGNEWINFLYVSVSGSCESMIRYTADLGKLLKVLCHARIFSVPGNNTTCWEIPS